VRGGDPPEPRIWGGVLAATVLFSLTGNLWLSALAHLIILGLLERGEAFPSPKREANEMPFSQD
jgi:hypothetical protein